ncbi:MAG: 16S rRNA (guanine(527)-N(7))-methyltransferase RsmG [Thermaurantimonas sp.]|uniref:16S rRNA (guanine(527)-N(7))-methyltransferase RsmG n=1 Tax=Thermaurantimonas sp. TaxID=2681568 RepID=UPI00391C7B76
MKDRDELERILKYFSSLKEEQIQKFANLKALYVDWNARINVISRKDMDNFYLHHVLHSLAIARYTSFFEGASVMDVGTGGGFPGIPLAIVFPEVEFHLVDSIGKKIRVVQEVASALSLENVVATQARAEGVKKSFNYIVSRAVTSLPEFAKWVKGKLVKNNPAGMLPPSVLYLKGGDISPELVPPVKVLEVKNVSEWFEEPFFETKKLVVFQV